MGTFDVIVTAALMTLVVTSWPSVEAWKKDIKVEYYGFAVLRCLENGTVVPDTSSVFWITSDAGLLTDTTPVSDFPLHVQLVNGVISTLNVTQVDDAVFGYYTCVMVRTDGQVSVARWGLNVDGADFSRLEEQYRNNAVVGAIAATVMIVLLGGACLVWHFRFSKQASAEGPRNGGVVEADELKNSSTNAHVFHNGGYDDPMPQMVREGSDLQEFSSGAQADTQQEGAAESCKL